MVIALFEPVLHHASLQTRSNTYVVTLTEIGHDVDHMDYTAVFVSLVDSEIETNVVGYQ